MAFRWSKTISAYNKWAYIFDNELPCQITTKQSALTVVTYIRDVIEFAHLNNVKGADWYKTVSVIPQGVNLIEIKKKRRMSNAGARLIAESYISRSVFDLMSLQQNMKLDRGTKFYSTEDFEDLSETMLALGVTLRQCVELPEENIIEVTDNGYENTEQSSLLSDETLVTDSILGMLDADEKDDN